MSDRDFLSEDEAARLWQRAAALQAEAAQRAEAAADEDDSSAEAGDRGDDASESGYELAHVRAAAVEAGIGAEYLDAALVDLKAERALPQARSRGVVAKRVLGPLPSAITLKRTIAAPPTDVLEAMKAVFTKEPYGLTLTDRKGNVLEGGVLVFDIEGASAFVEGFRGKTGGADVHQVYISLRALDGGESCEVTLRGPTAWAETRNTGIGAAVIAVTGAGGMALGGGVGGAIAAAATAAGIAAIPIAGAIAAGVSVLGFLGGGAGGTAAFRALYRYSLRQGENALDGLLSALTIRAEGGWGLDAEESPMLPTSSEPPQLSP